MIKNITYKEAIDFLLPKHYSGRKPTISFSYGWYENGALVAVATVGKPASPSLCSGICGEEYKKSVYELNRVCTNGEMKSPLSMFIGKMLKDLKKQNLILVSFADTQMSHCGYIYQATNWLYTGASKKRTDKYAGKGKHSRHYDKDQKEVFRLVRSSKHRYVKFVGSKGFVKKVSNAMNYQVLPYPKTENKRYILGDIIKQELIRV